MKELGGFYHIKNCVQNESFMKRVQQDKINVYTFLKLSNSLCCRCLSVVGCWPLPLMNLSILVTLEHTHSKNGYHKAPFSVSKHAVNHTSSSRYRRPARHSLRQYLPRRSNFQARPPVSSLTRMKFT